jgi:drug/metabolite transporter (DMT)-like permease
MSDWADQKMTEYMLACLSVYNPIRTIIMPLTALILALCAILLWSFLALLGAGLQEAPPLLTVAIALLISGMVSMVRIRDWKAPLKTLAVGVGGLFGYHFFYFTALQHAPAVEASLMNYLWPLLIVVLSPLFLPSFPLRPNHVIGAVIGLCGAGLIVTGGRIKLDVTYLDGYLYAALAALIWASYSLMTKRLPVFSTGAVGAFCFLSGALSLGIYFVQGGSLASIQELSLHQWVFLLLLGVGPLGAAFFVWDAALKRGDPRIIGAMAYSTPLLSTLNLVWLGGYSITWVSAAAVVLIVSGAVIGSLGLRRRDKT